MQQKELSYLVTARPKIDYSLIASAISFYKKRGYTYIEVPWLVSEASIKKTLPAGNKAFVCEEGTLVGSAEQSFLEIFDSIANGEMYVAASPCFRNEIPDDLHQTSFFKVELFSSDPGKCVQFLEDARTFYQEIGLEVAIKETDVGFDLEYEGVEVGSYGPRSAGKTKWSCGTGLAEPRASTLIRGFVS